VGSIQATEEFEALFGPLGMSSQYGREFDIDQVDSSPTPGRKEYMVANLLEPRISGTNAHVSSTTRLSDSLSTTLLLQRDFSAIPLLRTTSQERSLDSTLAWANGESETGVRLIGRIFGPENAMSKYNTLVIPEGGTKVSAYRWHSGSS